MKIAGTVADDLLRVMKARNAELDQLRAEVERLESQNDLLLNQMASINSALDRAPVEVYDFAEIGPIHAVNILVETVERLQGVLKGLRTFNEPPCWCRYDDWDDNDLPLKCDGQSACINAQAALTATAPDDDADDTRD